MNKSIREQILDGTFVLAKEPNAQQKKIENLQSWKAFYLNRCTDGTGNKVEVMNHKTNKPMLVDIQVSRKVPFQDWMFIPRFEGKPNSFTHKYMENGNGKYLKTSKDSEDEQSAFFIEKEVQEYYNRNNRRN